ncbi:abortive infection family protein [Phocaeicola sartorii]|uniref:abortive infection family protein n=1 Tax=Phocaeicola sartorii TaxID=671267 RepID=UPI0025A9CEDB|nr:abortive infection family protein [Phocaeicola sartorii]
MAVISKKDEGTLLLLYNRNGYVLDFTDNTFDVFTTASVGVAIKSKYGLSKGKSLVAYLNEANDVDRTKLLLDLFQHYEEDMEYEYNKDYEYIAYWGSSISRYDEKYAKIYLRCKDIVNAVKGSGTAINQAAETLKEKFSSEYLSRQIDLMVKMQNTDPTNAIGMAKELIESCCMTVLDELGISYTKNDDVPQLADKTLTALNLLPSNVQPTDRGADAIKAVLGNLRAIPTKLAEIRNPFGSGHGKSASFQGLEVRHAKLAVGSSITFVDFIWSTYESTKH